MEWPWPISKDELETGMYMKSLSPKREVAAFLELRSLCLRQHKQMKQHLTVKLFADDLRRQEGVNLDKLNQLIKREAKTIPVDEGIRSVFLYQTLTNTNSWRMPGYERDAPGKRATFSVERFEPK
jgi:uncharacterized protein YeaO (DUF488 family)